MKLESNKTLTMKTLHYKTALRWRKNFLELIIHLFNSKFSSKAFRLFSCYLKN